jgi:hypothetical protein
MFRLRYCAVLTYAAMELLQGHEQVQIDCEQLSAFVSTVAIGAAGAGADHEVAVRA